MKPVAPLVRPAAGLALSDGQAAGDDKSTARPVKLLRGSGREPESTILVRRIAELSAVQRIETVGTRPPISLPLQSSGWDDSGIG